MLHVLVTNLVIIDYVYSEHHSEYLFFFLNIQKKERITVIGTVKLVLFFNLKESHQKIDDIYLHQKTPLHRCIIKL